MRIMVDAYAQELPEGYKICLLVTHKDRERLIKEEQDKKKQSAYIKKTKEVKDPKEVIKAIKDKFYSDIAAWKEKNPGKYPSGFYKVFYEHWTMATQDGTAIRLQDKEKAKYWKLGARLNTAWTGGYHTLEQKQVWWEQDKEKK